MSQHTHHSLQSMRRSDRAKRIDYKEFHSSGRRVLVVPEVKDVEDIIEGVESLFLENNQVGATATHEYSVSPLSRNVSQFTDVPLFNGDTSHRNQVAISHTDEPPPIDECVSLHNQDLSLKVIPLKEVATDLDVHIIKESSYPDGNQVSTPHTESALSNASSSPFNQAGLSFNKDIASFSIDPVTLSQQSTFGDNSNDILEAIDTDLPERAQDFRLSQDHSFIHTPEDSDSAPFLSFDSSSGTDTEDLEVTAVVVDPEEAEVSSESAEVETLSEVQKTEALKMTEVNDLVADEATISEDIDDFLDENIIREIGNAVEDYDRINQKIEDLRSAFRGKHKQLKSSIGDQEYADKYADQCRTKLDAIKDYIMNLKQARRTLRAGEDTKAQDVSRVQKAKFQFLGNEIDAAVNKLTDLFSLGHEVWKAETDEKISKRRSEITEQVKEVTAISTTIKELVEAATDEESFDEVRDKKKNYEALLTLKDEYNSRLQKEVKDRQIDEKKAFNKSKLNIKLPKFKGYDSSQDIYTFQSNFEKIHLKDTPRHLLPDLLKNNFLENPALLMVKDIDDINEIWARLKDAYGDCKLMLKKKLNELNNIDVKQKDLSKVADALTRIINLMKDLVSLSKQHSIQNHLFYGNTLDRIYRMIGEERLRRWLTKDESSGEGEPLWNGLVEFLEKELKVAQKSALVLGKGPKEQPHNDSSRDKGSRQSSHHTRDGPPGNANPLSQQLKPCVICNATDHTPTNGPGGSKLIQYFACPKFAAWTNSERFSFIFSKKLCFQCLFPGAEKDKGKHKEGKCQRDFICPHADHNDFTSKKHVLVCDEHKAEEANKAVLEKYKKRCILRQNQVDLPSFSKEIAIHHTFVHHSPIVVDNVHPVSVAEALTVTPDEDNIETDDEAIYVFQTISIDGKRYSVFYDGDVDTSVQDTKQSVVWETERWKLALDQSQSVEFAA